MNKGQQQEHGQAIRTPGYNAAVAEIMANSPLASWEEVISGSLTVEQRAMRHDLCVGMLRAFNESFRLGRAPKSKRAHVQARHLNYDE